MISEKNLKEGLVNFRAWLKKLEIDPKCPNCGGEGVASLYCRNCNSIYVVNENETGILGFATMFKDRKTTTMPKSSLENKK